MTSTTSADESIESGHTSYRSMAYERVAAA
jgi:hypothetical protein